ncbi:MAG: arginine--tRNA ligase, partial [Mogibacterium sp.]|nr:arginine--tRNA ligase [Mogibacterium sp.]
MTDYKELIAEAIYDESLGLSKDEIKGWIEIPSDESMGDYAFPCFRLAKVLRKAPPLIAADIAGRACDAEAFAKVENVNAYVNFFIDRAFFAKELINDVNEAGDSYGRSNVGQGRKVIVEYSS